MADKKKKGFNIMVDPENVVYSTISRSKDYNSARTTIKLADKAYMSIGIDWEEDGEIPEHVLNMMSMMQANEKKSGQTWAGMEEDFEIIKAREAK